MKNQKGITLVALVVTIIVLLILAGVTIAMLTGENGIITNTQKADASNTEGNVIERMGLAYSTAKTDAMVKMALQRGYQPNGTTTTGDVTTENGLDLAKVVAKELGITFEDNATSGTVTVNGCTYTVVYSAENDTITMTYNDPTFDLPVKSEAKDNRYARLEGVITLTSTTVKYTTEPTRGVN